MKRFVLNLSLVVVAVIVTLGLAEVALYITGSFPPGARRFPGDLEVPVRGSTDRLVGWKLEPGAVRWDRPEHGEFAVAYRANSRGFRDDEFVSPPGRRKIVLLGDSFTFGAGVEEESTFAELLESRLGATTFNLGIIGHGVSQMLPMLEHYALPLDPDLIILTFVADDMRRSMDAYTYKSRLQRPTFWLRHGRLELITEENRPGPVLSSFNRHSRLLAAWRRAEWKLLRWRPGGSVWRVNRALFEAIRDRCAEAGVELLVVFLPTDRHAGWQLGPVLAPEFAELGIRFLDLTSVTQGRTDELFFRNDPHLNASGHEVVANAIAAELAAPMDRAAR